MMTNLLQAIWDLCSVLIVLGLPGLAWLAWFPAGHRDPLERLADGVGVSAALTAVVALVFFETGVRVSATGLGLIYAGLALVALLGWLRRRRRPRPESLLAAGLGGLFLLAMIAWRLYQARTLALPAWVDSVHHVLIVRQILEKGGLPADLGPDIPVPFYYHYGFHALAAVFSAISRLSPDQAVLIFGQILNALVGVSTYRLARSLWKSTWRAVAAAALVTWVAQMPAYYLTWGRYTLLSGLVLLPLAMAQAIEITRSAREAVAPRIDWRQLAALALLTAGVLLSHYLTGILLALFLLVLAIDQVRFEIRRRGIRPWNRAVWVELVGGGGIGLLVAAPWLWRIWTYSRASFSLSLNLAADAPDQVYFSNYLQYLSYLLGPYQNYVLLGFGVLGFAWAVLGDRRPDGLSRVLAGWAFLLCLLTVPWGLRLGPFRPDHMAIVLFLPAALLVGHLLISACEALCRVSQGRVPVWSGALAVLLIFCGWGMTRTADILNTSTILAGAADRSAVEWVAHNTPADAVFWINVTPWQGSVYRGVDGGWWILPLTGRQTLLPPVPYTWGSQEYAQQITGLAERSAGLTGCDSAFWDVVRDGQVDYLYLREGVGSLQSKNLAGCAGLRAVYASGGVTVYQVDPSTR